MKMESRRLQVKNGGHVYRVPEDMFPHVAQAMIDGGTAEWLPQVETSALSRVANTATKFLGTPFRYLGSPLPSALVKR